MSAGGRHTCAITDAESLLCWGADAEAQRGTTLDDESSAHGTDLSQGLDPDAGAYLAAVSRVLDGAKQVAAGGAHTCALLQDGSVSCWGRNLEGQVQSPAGVVQVQAPANTGVVAATHIDAGARHTCAVVPEGVECWGSGLYGQSGREQTERALAPELVPDTQGAVEVSCGVRHTCARMNTREVRCWGELIDDTGAPYVTATATPVPELRALQISAGAGQTCALTEDYAVVCWGRNASGQLGDGTFNASASPVPVLGFTSGAGQVAAGGGEIEGELVGHSCAIDKSSQVACWGRDTEGQLGVGLGGDSAKPEVVLLGRVFNASDQPTLSGIEQLDLGGFHSCGVGSQGSIYCWGDDDDQQLGTDQGLDMRDMRDMPDAGPMFPGRAQRVRRFGSMR